METFEEILKVIIHCFEPHLLIAQEQQVDFILLGIHSHSFILCRGGDLFHENKPSRKILYQTMSLLRKYALGNKECMSLSLLLTFVDLEFLTNPEEAFPEFKTANFLDQNYNIQIPVFSIHGNHDDPCGDGHLCALDILAASGLVNYFGKSSTVDDITVKPIVLSKGDTCLALYGLGNIKDERLNRSFKNKKVKIAPCNRDFDAFNLFVIHQNRAAHGANNHIPENFLPSFLDLVMVTVFFGSL